MLLDVTAKSSFVSIRANTALTRHCFYYEVQLFSSGVMQIGWATLQTPFSRTDGVGDDRTSFAYDGHRVKKWNCGSTTYGEQWVAGDIIGTLLDLTAREISFWRNNKFLGVAFTEVPVGHNVAYFPAASLEKDQRILFNFGLRPFNLRCEL